MKKPYTMADFYEGLSELTSAKFFILDMKEKRSIAVQTESEHGYNGIVFKKENNGYNSSPIYIAKTFIENEAFRYDFTTDFQTAFEHANDQGNH